MTIVDLNKHLFALIFDKSSLFAGKRWTKAFQNFLLILLLLTTLLFLATTAKCKNMTKTIKTEEILWPRQKKKKM